MSSSTTVDNYMENIDRSAIGRRSKNKGKAGERRTAQMLMTYTKKNFRRIPCSGSFSKIGVPVAGHVFSGDVICDDANFCFSVENKNSPAKFSFQQLAASPRTAAFTEWWVQCCQDAKLAKRLPLLIFKPCISSTATVAAEHVALNLAGLNHLKYPVDAPKIILDLYHAPIVVEYDNEDITIQPEMPYIINWRSIQKHVDPERFFALNEVII